MSMSEKEVKKLERSSRMALMMATKAGRNKSLTDKLCRMILNKATKLKPEDDFMRDPEVDNDFGFDAKELDRFQRGETV